MNQQFLSQQQALQRQTPPGQAPFGMPNLAELAPVTFWEWFGRTYPPDQFVYNTQFFMTTIKAGTTAITPGILVIQTPLFAFSFRSFGFVTGTGAAPTFPYRIGIALGSGNDWTFGQWSSQIVTGNGTSSGFDFVWPREVAASTQLSVSIDNTLNAGQITVDAGLVGLEPRRRDRPLDQQMGLAQR